MTNNNKNFKKKKLKIGAPEGWINLLNEYLEKIKNSSIFTKLLEQWLDHILIKDY